VLLFVLAWLGDFVNRSALPELGAPVPAVDVALLAILALAVAFRRRYPLSVLAVTTGAFLVVRIQEVPEASITSIILFLALFSAGAYSHHSRRDLTRGAAVAVSMGVLLWSLYTNAEGLPGSVVAYQVFALLLNVAFFAAGWLMGDLWRRRGEDRAELQRRAEELEAQRHRLAEQAVANERLRIAQELHDVVGHHVSVMGVQAGAARRTLGSDSETVAGLLAGIEDSGRQAVVEMGRLVGLLRDPGDQDLEPQPRLDRLAELVEQMRSAGLDIRLHRIGAVRPLDATTDLTAYRIVQEALTNALKHASAPRAEVVVGFLADHLELRVRNPAVGSGEPGPGGRGLVGMRERAAFAGGSLEVGRKHDGWFEVKAVLPYRRSP
jgi:signal transduction histidine kinase